MTTMRIESRTGLRLVVEVEDLQLQVRSEDGSPLMERPIDLMSVIRFREREDRRNAEARSTRAEYRGRAGRDRLQTAMALVTVALVLVVAAACGRTPTAPPPCTKDTAVRVDTIPTVRRINGVVIDTVLTIAYYCR